MYQDSLEYKIETIYHPKTKEYFEEVYSSYNNGNYRSAIVILHSVVICDLIYKLQELSESYADATATSILEKIKKEKKENPIYGKWETLLLQEIKSRTNLFEPQDLINIEYLKENRNLAAHPVLDQLDILLKPNRDTVRAVIVNMLDGILCKQPLLSNRFIKIFLEDLETLDRHAMKPEDFERYLYSKYLTRLNKPTEEKLFKDLWKFSFKLNDSRTIQNREMLYRALLVLIKLDYRSFLSLLESNKTYYSNVLVEDKIVQEYLINFWSVYPETYRAMDESIRIKIESLAKSNLKFEVSCVFLSESLEHHLKKIRERIDSTVYIHEFTIPEPTKRLLFELAMKVNKVNIFLDFLIALFKESQSYDQADYNYQEYILPYGDLFNKKQIIEIIESINDNGQLYNRRGAVKDNRQFLNIIKIDKEDMDISIYPNFKIY